MHYNSPLCKQYFHKDNRKFVNLATRPPPASTRHSVELDTTTRPSGWKTGCAMLTALHTFKGFIQPF